MLVVLSFAAGVGLVAYAQNAVAAPANGALAEAAAAAVSPLQHVQYDERHTRHGIVKCYRDLVIGPYLCHYYRNPLYRVPDVRSSRHLRHPLRANFENVERTSSDLVILALAFAI